MIKSDVICLSQELVYQFFWRKITQINISQSRYKSWHLKFEPCKYINAIIMHIFVRIMRKYNMEIVKKVEEIERLREVKIIKMVKGVKKAIGRIR